jgi:Tfp pilus assembly ATPase PilU
MGNIPALESLMLPAVLADLVMERRGLILIVGSTGSASRPPWRRCSITGTRNLQRATS